MEELEQLRALATGTCQRLLSEGVSSAGVASSNQDAGLRDVLRIILEQLGGLSREDLQQIHIQVLKIVISRYQIFKYHFARSCLQVYAIYQDAEASEFKINRERYVDNTLSIRNII